MAAAAQTTAPAIIPLPEHMTVEKGDFNLRPSTKILADASSRETAEFLAAKLRRGTGFPMSVSALGKSSHAIRLETTAADKALGAEGYELTVHPDSVLIRAPTQAGLFYGVQTLLQLFPPQILSSHPGQRTTWRAPCVRIKDRPRLAWRGLMLDVSRHFFDKSEVEQILDAMAFYKLNTFHWHLVDDEGWRIEIKKYPQLTEVGAWRKGIDFGLDPKFSHAFRKDGKYGGFYTQSDIAEIVRYAAARHITIVPEIEMPGHSTAAIMTFPQLSCHGGPFSMDRGDASNPGIYCVGNEETFTFLENVLTEVCQMFPGPFIHVGGDEVSTSEWKTCPKCQERMKTEHLASERQLESYLIARIEKFLNAHGKRLIGWSEIREGGLAKNAAIMDWIGGAREAASTGHDVVMSPEKYCYLDHYQSLNHLTEPKAFGGYLPLTDVYHYNPIPAQLSAAEQSRILGAQCNLWAEFVPSISHAEYMIFPRECALAEIVWSPEKSRNWDDFQRRIKINEKRLVQLGVNYRPN